MKNTNLIIEVVTGHDRPESRKFGDREVYQQKAYMHNGGAFPQEIKLTFDSLPSCLEVGKYALLPSSFKSGKYGDLEIDRFNMQFEKLNEQQLKQVG
jgi:hypothetical protein